MPSRLLQCLDRHASDRPDALAVREIDARGGSGSSLSYAQLRERVDQLAAKISRNCPAGGIVVLQCSNSVNYHVAFLAILAGGCSSVAISCDAPQAELSSVVERCGAAAIIREDLSLALTEVEHPRTLAEPSLLLLSSGTTGKPKIVVRSGASVDAVARAMCEAIGFTHTDRILATLPLCHSYGLEHGLLAPVYAGSAVHLMRSLELPGLMRQLTADGITLLPSVPSIYEMIAQLGDAGARFASLRTAYSAGACLPAGVFEALESKYRLRVGQLYGATEVGSVTFNEPHRSDFDPASVGQPMRGVEVRILDMCDDARSLAAVEEGQVAIRADSMFSGYIENDEVVPADGFFRTGDLGRLSSSGDLTITGRIKLLIDIGGLKVNPLEVEAALMEHESVGACVVVPVQLSSTIYRLKALVTPRDPVLPPAPAQLRQFLRQRLTPYKVPRVIELRDSLPRSATGKILRHMVSA